MKILFLQWICERFSFWGLACYACDSCTGWHIKFCSLRSNSYVAIATCRQCNAVQFLKKARQASVQTINNAQSEYETLQLLTQNIAGDYSLLVPQAHLFSPKVAAFSMDYIQGESLDKRMQSAKNKIEFEECLRISATWLRRLHEAPLEKYCIAGRECIAILQELEDNCGSLINRNILVARALELMHYSLSSFKELPVKRVPLHSDFKASNLIRTPQGEVYGIDLRLRFMNPGEMDIAQFILDILLNRSSIKKIALDRHYIAQILDVFLKAYGDNSQLKKDFAAWWLLYFLLSKWEANLNGFIPSLLIDRRYNILLGDVMFLFKIK